MIIETSDIDSFIIPAYEPTKQSYIINETQTGTDKRRVNFGLFTQSEIVTSVDAHIGKRLIADRHDAIVRQQLTAINKIGHANEFAHFLPLFIKMLSRAIPTRFGIAPAHAPRKR